MPNMVCTKCQVALKPVDNDTVVIETASFGPYKVWNADTLKCPKCGIEIVAGFGQKPIREDHFAPDFQEWLEKTKSIRSRVQFWNEK